MSRTITSDEFLFYEPWSWSHWSPEERCLYLTFWAARERAEAETFTLNAAEMARRSGVPSFRAKAIIQDWLEDGLIERAGEPQFCKWRIPAPKIEIR